MFATLLTVCVLILIFIPGIVLAYKNRSLTLGLMVKCLLLNIALFALLGLLFRAVPWLVDPRFKL